MEKKGFSLSKRKKWMLNAKQAKHKKESGIHFDIKRVMDPFNQQMFTELQELFEVLERHSEQNTDPCPPGAYILVGGRVSH